METPKQHPTNSVELFSESLKVRDAEFKALISKVADALRDTHPELACDVLEAGILYNNIVALYGTMLIAWIDAS